MQVEHDAMQQRDRGGINKERTDPRGTPNALCQILRVCPTLHAHLFLIRYTALFTLLMLSSLGLDNDVQAYYIGTAAANRKERLCIQCREPQKRHSTGLIHSGVPGVPHFS